MKALSPVGAGLSRLPAPMGLGGRVGRASVCGLAGIATTKYTWATHEEAPMEDEVRVAATRTGVAQVFALHALKRFAPDTRVRKMLFKADQLCSEIACYEPGQSTALLTPPRDAAALVLLD